MDSETTRPADDDCVELPDLLAVDEVRGGATITRVKIEMYCEEMELG